MITEGEEFIHEFLESKQIKYRKEEMIESLKNDSKSHRLADVYLPKYKVYIEYFGQWNNEKERPRYQEKRNCYIENKIPCIILYPENLGILDYIFHKRLIYVLSRYKMEKELRKYRYDVFLKGRADNFMGILIGSIILGFSWPWFIDSSPKGIVEIVFLFVFYQFYVILKSIFLIKMGKDPIKKKYFEDK